MVAILTQKLSCRGRNRGGECVSRWPSGGGFCGLLLRLCRPNGCSIRVRLDGLLHSGPASDLCLTHALPRLCADFFPLFSFLDNRRADGFCFRRPTRFTFGCSRPCQIQESLHLPETRDFSIDRGKNGFRHSAEVPPYAG